MSYYPIAVKAQDLYTASTTRRHPLGTVAYFKTANGTVEAMYCANNNSASLAAGLAVGIGASGYGYADTAAVAVASAQREVVLGGLAVSMQGTHTSNGATGYGWVILRGPQTNLQLGATLASSAAARGLVISSNGMLSTNATVFNSHTSSGADVPRILALLRATTTTVDSAAASGIVDWLWK